MIRFRREIASMKSYLKSRTRKKWNSTWFLRVSSFDPRHRASNISMCSILKDIVSASCRDLELLKTRASTLLCSRVYWHGGMKDKDTDWLDLQVPDGTDWIEFMLNVPADADKKLLGVMNHIALGVPDIHAAAKQLLTNGMQLSEEPKIGRDGKWQLNLYDPDDTRVELMEFTPVEKPCCSEFTGPHPKP